MFCAQCGKSIPDNSTFCPACGWKATNVAPTPVPNVVPEPVQSVTPNVNQNQQASAQQVNVQQINTQQTSTQQAPVQQEKVQPNRPTNDNTHILNQNNNQQWAGISPDMMNQSNNSGFGTGNDEKVTYQNLSGSDSEEFNASTSYISSTGAVGFVSKDEKPLFSLKNGTLSHLVTGRGWGVKDDAVITNKRLYYHCKVGFINKYTDEEMVNLEDISGTKIMNHNPLGLLITSIIFFLASIICTAIGLAENEDSVAIAGAVAFLLAIIELICYFVKRSSVLSIEYPGGFIEFNVKHYGMSNIRFFQRCIYAAKEIQNTESFKRIKPVKVVNK